MAWNNSNFFLYGSNSFDVLFQLLLLFHTRRNKLRLVPGALFQRLFKSVVERSKKSNLYMQVGYTPFELRPKVKKYIWRLVVTRAIKVDPIDLFLSWLMTPQQPQMVHKQNFQYLNTCHYAVIIGLPSW